MENGGLYSKMLDEIQQQQTKIKELAQEKKDLLCRNSGLESENKKLSYALFDVKKSKEYERNKYKEIMKMREQGLDVNSDIEYREDVALKHEIQEIARYQKAILRECISRLDSRKDDLNSKIALLNKRLEHVHDLDKECIEHRRDNAIAECTGVYDAIEIVHNLLNDLENLSEWKD